MRGSRTIANGRRLWLTTPVVVGTVLALGAGAAGAALPAGVTNVTVTASTTQAGIDAHMHAAASIAGKITAATGGGALSAVVTVYHSGHFVSSAVTNGSGNYLVGGLAAGSYAVCVGGSSVFSGGSSTTGYLGRCYTTAAWNGGAIPGGATLVSLTAGQQKTGVNIALRSGAAVAGKATNPGGTGLANVTVVAHNRSNGVNYFGFTGSGGAYRINGLTAASKGYFVCFDPRGVATGTGFRPRCYKKAPWNGFGSAYPSTSTAVSVSLGHAHTGITAALPRAGAIAGAVTDAGNGHAVAGAAVLVFSSGGKALASAATNSTGHYTVRGLAAAAGDRVCVAPFPKSASTTYRGKCWKNVAYNGRALPSGTTAVAVHLAKTHTGISFKLGKTVVSLGSIAGTVTEQAGATALQGATVDVFTSGGTNVGSAATDSSGHYVVSNLRANTTGYVVCVNPGFAFSGTTSTPPTGWAPRCYPDVAWNGLAPPGGATRLPLSAGQHRTGVNIAVHVGGAISGAALDFNAATGISGATVKVFTPGGALVTTTSTSFDGSGSYTVTGLSPANYVVCFDARFNFVTPRGWRPVCYNDVAWTG